MISNIQLLRAIAALAVVFGHSGFSVNGVHTQFQGVPIFFCISGFIMVHISRQSVDDFFVKRIIRIVPLYWVAVLAFYFWSHLGLSNPPYVWPILWERLTQRPLGLIDWVSSNHGLNAQTVTEILKSLFFVPYKDAAGNFYPLLGVGWTLNLEMYFYALFAISLKLNQKSAPIITGILIASVAAISTFLPSEVIKFYGKLEVFYFILGMGCYYLWKATQEVSPNYRRFYLTFAMIVAVFWVIWNLTPYALSGSIPSDIINLIFAPLVIMAALWNHSAGNQFASKWVAVLGGASYSIYLFHSYVMETLRPVGAKWEILDTAAPVGLVIGMVLSTLLGIAAHKWIEQPLANYLKIPKRQPTLQAAPIS